MRRTSGTLGKGIVPPAKAGTTNASGRPFAGFGVPPSGGAMHGRTMTWKTHGALGKGSVPPAKAGTTYPGVAPHDERACGTRQSSQSRP